MSHLRAVVRLLGMTGLTGACFFAWALTRLLNLFSPGAGRWTQERITVAWASSMLHHMGGRIQVHGEPARIPHMLVSNHLSYVDILVLLSQGCWTIVAKAEIARWPLMGAIARSVGTVFIDRSKRSNLARVNREIAGILGSGRSILVFPEGTSSGGAAVLPFKPALFEVAVDTACPVNIAVLGYRTGPGLPPAQEVVCWWRDMTFPDHLYRLLRLPGFQATVSFGASSISEPDRKSYARRAHAAVSELFVPVFPQG